MPEVAGATTAWRRNDNVLARSTSRSVLLMASQTDAMHRLEGAALFVWLELEQPATDEELVGNVAARIGVARAEAETFVLSARRTLVEIDAIVGSDD